MKNFTEFLKDIKVNNYSIEFAEFHSSNILAQEGELIYEFPEGDAEQALLNFMATDLNVSKREFERIIDSLLESGMNVFPLGYILYQINKADIDNIRAKKTSLEHKILALTSKVTSIANSDNRVIRELFAVIALS